MFKHSADRLPVAIIFAITCLDFALYFTVENPWFLAVFWLVLLVPKGKICAWNHHHQHVRTFNSKTLNRFLELIYALHTGVSTNLWVLHHVLGHHRNYLDQSKDQSRWKNQNGEQMGEMSYTLNVAATAYYRGYEVGKQHPRLQREFLLFGGLTLAFVIALVCYKPIAGLFLFVLPMICGLTLTAWATYEHHAGLDTDNEMEASYNNMSRFYNLCTGNLGYHTAHHYKQGVHWSKLPELHAKIESQIPATHYKNTWL